MQYDDIIVGAGSSGAVLAARLSEDPVRTVLLLEAGPDYPTIGQTPDDLLHSFASMAAHDWGLAAQATPGREIPYPRGMVTGGSSAVNATMALRGTPQDFDEWVEWGNDEWSFAKVLPFYRKLENDRDYSGDFHGTSGPILIERLPKQTWQPIGSAFFEACRATGFAEVTDHNDPASTGVGPTPRNRHNQVRISTAIGYLAPARNRLNLTIRSAVNVHRVLVENGRAIGVELECGGVIQRVHGLRVTISAGAINSPAMLMRSGIGPHNELEELGINCLLNLAGVGKNLIDHPMLFIAAKPVPGVAHDVDVTTPVIVRYTAGSSREFNDMQLGAYIFFDEALIPGFSWLTPPPIVLFTPGLQRPRSRGHLRLTTADPDVPPEIHINFVNDSEDVRRMLEGVRIAWRVMHGPHLSPYIKEILGLTQEIVDSDSALADFIRDNCTTNFHPVATARMGPESDRMAVVDQYCRVHGVEGLRVVDASVMPNIVRANTNLTCIMIGERVAQWMRAQK
ncbi:MAG TPA: GMC family oxidoreductase N-terminal domain-containing protein [Candidatus Binataceae bacterium]|nr:GMC family oxidoreductase N-terminal domain-containing protein [Candidatus Binataceae bacterium]